MGDLCGGVSKLEHILFYGVRGAIQESMYKGSHRNVNSVFAGLHEQMRLVDRGISAKLDLDWKVFENLEKLAKEMLTAGESVV